MKSWGLGSATTGAAILLLIWLSNRLDSAARISPPPAPDAATERIEWEVSINLPANPVACSAQQLLAEGDRVAVELMQRYPESPAALHVSARHYAALQQYSKAEEIWRQCLALDPRQAGPRIGLALAAMEQGHDDEAIAVLEEARSRGSHTSEVFARLAQALEKVGRLDEAEAALKQGVACYPTQASLWISCGQIQLQLEKLTEAAASLRTGIQLQPDSATAEFALATVFKRLGEQEHAAEHFRRFSDLNSQNLVTKEGFQTVYDAVLRYLVVTTLCHGASIHDLHGASHDAERLYLRALELAPAGADACRWLASFYHKQQRIGDAHLVQRRLVELEPDRVQNYLNLASLSANLGRLEEAESALLTAVRLAPSMSAAHHTLASFYWQGADYVKARHFAQQAAHLEPTPENYLFLAAVCEQMNDVAGREAAERAARRFHWDDSAVAQQP